MAASREAVDATVDVLISELGANKAARLVRKILDATKYSANQSMRVTLNAVWQQIQLNVRRSGNEKAKEN